MKKQKGLETLSLWVKPKLFEVKLLLDYFLLNLLKVFKDEIETYD